jgi:hypothetical protein
MIVAYVGLIGPEINPPITVAATSAGKGGVASNAT